MAIAHTDLFQAIGSKTHWLVSRQRVLSQNIANSDTPRYKAKDIAPLQFDNLLQRSRRTPDRSNGMGAGSLKITNPRHYQNGGTFAGGSGKLDLRPLENRNPNEVSPDGNSVNLEEQLIKMGETSDQHSFMTSLARKYTQMYRLAVRSPS